MRYFPVIFLAIGLLFTACQPDDDNFDAALQAEIDNEKILAYLAANNISAEAHSSGLYYVIDTPGNNQRPISTSTVTVRYKGQLLNGAVFDETPGTQSRTFPLGGLIQGWRIGIPLLGKGGKGTFYIPSALGYGNDALPDIPANSVLIFEIELVDFQ